MQPELRAFYKYLLPGILLIPLFGAGLLLVWYAYKQRKETRYEIFDREIRYSYPNSSAQIEIVQIENVSTEEHFPDTILGIGTIVLETLEGRHKLAGLKDHLQIAGLIEHAAEAEKKRLARQTSIKARVPDQHPGTMDRMNDLTGMWQQGLITDEEFKKEKKHFE